MSNILEIIKQRRSVRKYKAKGIQPVIIEKLKQALIWAPSAGNLQARKFYFVFNPEIKSELARSYNREREFISQAPLVVVACTDEYKMKYGDRGKNIYLINDVGISLQNLTLVAKEQGLGSCWVGEFDEKAVKKILNLPTQLCPVILMPVGYPDETPPARPRVSAEEAVTEVK